MNILIDGNDRTKIGDFGLATRDFFIRKTATGEHEKNAYNRMTFSGRPSPLIRNVFYQMNRRRKIMIADDAFPNGISNRRLGEPSKAFFVGTSVHQPFEGPQMLIPEVF
ncbi:unnamed protein product [Dracunculus medinensis]|uniref:Protein kinase domain-containing protein n=1 Tax=Dracunculus medinensis TaxID=318479 RepID=A0A0N4UGT8_DRAME|nr:unnamed protein product [Dracunculus medinensis]